MSKNMKNIMFILKVVITTIFSLVTGMSWVLGDYVLALYGYTICALYLMLDLCYCYCYKGEKPFEPFTYVNEFLGAAGMIMVGISDAISNNPLSTVWFVAAGVLIAACTLRIITDIIERHHPVVQPMLTGEDINQ